MTDDTEPTKAELMNRIDDLESTVEQLMPSRRQFLRTTGAAALGGAAVYGATGNASAAANGSVGTSSNRVDITAENLDATFLEGNLRIKKGATLRFHNEDDVTDYFNLDYTDANNRLTLADTSGDIWRVDDGSSLVIDRDVTHNGAFSTDRATINSTGPILEMGTVDHGSINSGDTSTVTVNFQEDYGHIPAVICFAGSVSGGTLPSDVDVVARDITQTDFEHLVENTGSGVETLSKCGYIAIDDS